MLQTKDERKPTLDSLRRVFFAYKKRKSKKRLILRQNNLKIPFVYVKFQTSYTNNDKLNKKKRFVGKKHLKFRLFLVQKSIF